MKKLVILLAAALTFNSCSDSFLDLSNPSALSPSVYPKSMADMETIVTSVYANMVAVPLYGKRVMAKGTFCVDHTEELLAVIWNIGLVTPTGTSWRPIK